MWITTDPSGEKILWELKPDRIKNGWVNGGAFVRLGKFPFTDLPSFVDLQQWKDAPLQVKFEIKKR